MRSTFVLSVVLTAAIAAAAQQDPCIAPPLVITRAAIVQDGRLSPNREIAIDRGRILALGEAGRIRRPKGARVIDASGDTLFPGLIDAHAHLFDLGGPSPRPMYESPRENSFPITGRQLLRSGVTTARVHLFDSVHGPAFKREAESDCYPAPRLQIGGPGMTGGRPDMSGAFFTGYRSLEDASARLAAMRAAGADWVALHGLSRFPPGELNAIASEARKQGLRVMAEGDPLSHAEQALTAGVDSIEYLDRSKETGYPQDFIARLKRSQAYLVAPVGYYNRSVALSSRPAGAPDAIWFTFMPEAVAAEMRGRWSKWVAEPNRLSPVLDRLNQQYKILFDAGVKLAAGTDCGSPGNFQVDAMWWELETYRKLGIPAVDALKIATSGSAGLLRVADAGHLRRGARADFVLYRGDIRSGSFEMNRVRTVGKGGVLFVDEGQWTGK